VVSETILLKIKKYDIIILKKIERGSTNESSIKI